MIIDDFHIIGVSIAPGKANAKLIVDSDTVLSGPVARECLKSIAGRVAQIFEAGYVIDLV